jgi:hypothetical protein
MKDIEKAQMGASAMEAFFQQFAPYDAHAEIVLGIIFEMIYNSGASNEFVSIPDPPRQKGHEVVEHISGGKSPGDKNQEPQGLEPSGGNGV